MLPNLSPSWSIHAAGFQSSAGAVAVLSPSSANIASIVRTGPGVYDITLDAPIAPASGIFFPVLGVTGAGLGTLFIGVTAITDTIITVTVVTVVGAPTDAFFKFIYFRFRVP